MVFSCFRDYACERDLNTSLLLSAKRIPLLPAPNNACLGWLWVPCALLSFPTCLFLSGLVCMWQNLLKFSIILVGLDVQISHFFQTHYNCLESLRIVVASSFKNNFWSILYVSKTTEHISETLVWNAVYGFVFFSPLLLLLTCFSYLLCESNFVVRNAYCFPVGPVFWLFQQAIFILVGQ